jgi:3-dehydroquinate synthase
LKSILDLTYPIYIEEHDIHSLKDYVFKHVPNQDIYVITDQKVFNIYGKMIKDILLNIKDFIVLSAGESSKSMETYQNTIHALLEKGFKKGDVILAFGGGVVGDLAGFVASTLFRGVPFIQVPTTLLAQVDSSIGSKVGINTMHGKNLIGAFKEPSFVYIYPYFLKTLDKREYHNGLAEVIKAGFIKDMSIISDLEKDMDISTIIYKALQVKVDVVLNDPYETHERKILNFGHTLGHAIEKDFNYQTIKHGEAISHGMIYALKLGVKLGFSDIAQLETMKKILLKYQLLDQKIKPYEHYIKHTLFDKKRLGSGIDFIFISKTHHAIIRHIGFGDLYVD